MAMRIVDDDTVVIKRQTPKPVDADVKKDVGSTIGYTVGKVGTGLFSVVEGIADAGAWVMKQTGKVTSWMVDNPVGDFIFGKDAGDHENNPFYQIGHDMTSTDLTGMMDKALDETEMAQESYIEPGSLLANVASGVGQVGGMIVTGNIFGGAGGVGTVANSASRGQKILNSAKIAINNPTTKSMFVSTFGNSYSQASNNGADDLEATLYGLLNATKETGTEMMYGGLGAAFGKGALDDVAQEGIEKLIYSKLGETVKSKILSKTAQLGVGMLAEGFEEMASGILQPFVDAVYTHNLDFSSYNSLLDDFVVGALVSGVLQTGSNVVNLKGKNPQEVATKLQQMNLQEKLNVINTQTEKMLNNKNVDNKTKVDRINNQLDILNDQLTQEAPIGAIDIEGIYKQKLELMKKRDMLIENTTEQQKVEIVNTLTKQVSEVFNAPEGTVDNAIIESANDKVQQIEKLTDEVEKDKKIKVLSNKQNIKLNGQQYVNEAAAIVEQFNRNIPEGQKRIQIVTELNDEQRRVMDLGAVFGKQVIFTENLPFSGAVTKQNPNILFIDTKATSKLVTNEKGTMLYAMGHELFHSLKMSEPKTYNEFVEYTKETISLEQIINFVQNYDANNANQILNSLKIDGKFDIETLIKNPSKYKSQNRVLTNMVEEMVANEFGGMIADKTYMNKLYTGNPSLFEKVINAIRELFKSLDGSIYDSSLTQLQVERIRNDFENIVAEINATQETETKQTAVEVKETAIEKKKTETKKSSEYQIPETIYRSTNSGITGPKTHSVPGAKFYSTKQEISARYSKSGETKTANVDGVIKNPLIIEGNGQLYKNISFENKTMRTDDIVAIAKERGYDGVIFKNIIDSGPFFHGRIENPVSDIIVTIEQPAPSKSDIKTTEQPVETKQEIKKPVEVKEEVKPETQEMKTTQMDMKTWFNSINKMYDKYVETKDSERLSAVATAYDNYKKKGGTEVISELDSVVEKEKLKKQEKKKKDTLDKMKMMLDIKSKNDFISNLLNAQSNMKELPKSEQSNEKDSKGNLLSKNQQEFFKYSKVRDDKGRLLELYHGTQSNDKFDTFDKTKSSNFLKRHVGFFFTNNESAANTYGTTKQVVYLDIKKPLIIDAEGRDFSKALKRTAEQKNERIEFIKKEFKKLTKEQKEMGYNQAYAMSMQYETDVDFKNAFIERYGEKKGLEIYNRITNIFVGNSSNIEDGIERSIDELLDEDFHYMTGIEYMNTNEVAELAKRQNYDGVIFKNIIDVGEFTESLRNEEFKNTYVSDEYVVFNANQIKYTNNINPSNKSDNMKYLPKQNVAGEQKESQFYTNTVTNSPLFKSIFDDLSKNKDFRYYSTVSHKGDFDKAVKNIQTNGDAAISEFLAKDNGFTSVDSAMAKILIEYYQRTGDVQSEVVVATKIRKAITQGAQLTESAKIFKNLSPASVVIQVQADITRAMEELQTSSDPMIRAWVNENLNKANLTAAEREWVYRMAEKASKQTYDSPEYRRTYALIQAFVADRIPKSIATKVKAFRRMSMLFNPKTMIRNFAGNAIMQPVNRFSDAFGSIYDSYLSKKSGIRTQGTLNTKAFKEGKRQGLAEATQDFKLGINTSRTNPYEIQQGKTFVDKGVGKTLNWVEKWMNYGLNAGDRGYEEAYYQNSLANQMRLNGVTEATETMKQLAQQEAEKKTWKNDGKLMRLASSTRNLLNRIGFKGRKLTYEQNGNVDFGLGDMVLPFIMTPANLAVAIYDYSPAALLSVAKNAKRYTDALKTGKDVALAQKTLVDSFGKASTGVLLYALANVLAQAGLITGGEDDDKDIRATMRAQGYQPYSIKIGDFTFSYDWAQPLANPFATMAELHRQTEMNKNNPNKSDDANNAFKAISEAFTIGGDRLYEQSFLQSLKNLLSAESPKDGVIQFATDLPQSFVPTLFKQVADMIDGTAKSTYDGNNLLTTMFAKAMVKIPFLKSTLPTKKDILGNDVQMYGGENNIFNVMFNPANVSKDIMGDIGIEIMDVYNHTGENAVMPQVAIKYIDYDSNGDGVKERITFDNAQQSILQQYMGNSMANAMNEMLNNDVYQNASYEDKATALISLMQYSKAIALRDTGLVPDYEIKTGNAAQIDKYVTQGLSIPDAVMYDSLINQIKGYKDVNGNSVKGSENGQKAYAIMNMQISDNAKNIMLKLISPTANTPETVDSLRNLGTTQQFVDYYSLPRRDTFIIDKFSRDDYDIATTYFNVAGSAYIDFVGNVSEIKPDYDEKGNSIPNSKKGKVFRYIDSLPLNQFQKLYLFSISGYSVSQWKNQLFNYVNNMNISANEKKTIWASLGFE